MSGHSKWSTIKHKKAITDSKRGAVFTKLAKKITIAVKTFGSGNPEFNPTLRTILEDARSMNMPNDIIKRAIEKGLGSGDYSITEAVYEAYGPGGIGIIITTATDSKNRTSGEIKTLLDKNGGNLASPGSVAYMKHLSPIPMIELVDDDLEQASKLLELLDDHDDVTDLWTNLVNKSSDEQES